MCTNIYYSHFTQIVLHSVLLLPPFVSESPSPSTVKHALSCAALLLNLPNHLVPPFCHSFSSILQHRDEQNTKPNKKTTFISPLTVFRIDTLIEPGHGLHSGRWSCCQSIFLFSFQGLTLYVLTIILLPLCHLLYKHLCFGIASTFEQ